MLIGWCSVITPNHPLMRGVKYGTTPLAPCARHGIWCRGQWGHSQGLHALEPPPLVVRRQAYRPPLLLNQLHRVGRHGAQFETRVQKNHMQLANFTMGTRKSLKLSARPSSVAAVTLRYIGIVDKYASLYVGKKCTVFYGHCVVKKKKRTKYFVISRISLYLG